ncbi:MAG: hypothetical protein QG597_4450 [Actinomycetota bacterium]|jgi:hypothetical protein|nr:hypothetical protein [Actinomycetota bacterium]
MHVGEPHVTRRSVGLRDGTGPVAYEHSVIVLLPYRRYRRRAVPSASTGSPSVIELGEETRFGDELIVSRTTSQPSLTVEELAEMTGELAEAWVAMTAWYPSHGAA